MTILQQKHKTLPRCAYHEKSSHPRIILTLVTATTLITVTTLVTVKTLAIAKILVTITTLVRATVRFYRPEILIKARKCTIQKVHIL